MEGIAFWGIDTDDGGQRYNRRSRAFLRGGHSETVRGTAVGAENDAGDRTNHVGDRSSEVAEPESGRAAGKAINHLGDGIM
jgi:hypothetical protein